MEMFGAWAEEYGAAHEVLTSFGGKKIILRDPRALAHFYARESWTYVHTESTRVFLERGVCPTQ